MAHPDFHLTYDAASSSLALSGVLDRHTAGHVAAACELLARAGRARALIDVSGVERLSASVAQALGERVERARDHGVQIVLTASSDSPALEALAAAHVPHLLVPRSVPREVASR